MYGEEPSASADRMGPAAKPPWSGGGRSAAWPTRVVLCGAILTIGYDGVQAIIFDETPSAGNGAGNDTGAPASGFPVDLGAASAMRFSEVYWNYSPGSAAQQAQRLAAFIPANVQVKDLQFAWNGSGTSTARSTKEAGLNVLVSAEPSWLPVPPAALPSAHQASSGANARSALAGQLPGFFKAYASGDQAALGRYLAPGASIAGLGGAVNFGEITSLRIPPGGATRDITVTVNWTLPGQVSAGIPQLAATYAMSVVDQQSGRWYVKDIRASTQPMGNQ